MPEMTPHDRIMAAYRRQPTDCIPLAVYSRYLPRGVCERILRNCGLGVIDYYPPVSMLAPPWHLNPGYLSEVGGATFQIEYAWEDGHPVETRTYSTPVGSVSQQTTKDSTYGSDWISKFYVAELEDYKVLQYLVEHTVIRRNESALCDRVRNMGDDGVVLGRMDRCPYQKLLIELAGPERFLVDLATEPGPVMGLMQALDRKMDEAFEMVLESSVEAVWQPDNITADTTPPEHFDRYCRPFYEKHGEQMRTAGKPYVVHMDGRLKPLKSLIARSTFDAVESFSLPEIGGDLTLPQAQAAWPDKAVLPNFPAPLCTSSQSVLEAYLESLLAQSVTRAGLMIQISEDIPTAEWQRVLPILNDVIRNAD